MEKKNKPAINIKTIQKMFGLSFEQVMTIARKEKWKAINNRGVNFDKATVLDYFAKLNISEKYVTWKKIVELYGCYGISKENVFSLIHEQRWKPVSKVGLWTFEHAPIAAYFNNQK